MKRRESNETNCYSMVWACMQSQWKGQELLSFLPEEAEKSYRCHGKMGTHLPGKMGTWVPIFPGEWGPGFPSSQENGDPGSPFYHEDGDPIGKMGTTSVADHFLGSNPALLKQSTIR